MQRSAHTTQAWVDRCVAQWPDLPLVGPMIAYLLLLSLLDWRAELGLGDAGVWVLHLIRGFGALAVLWLVRKHLPAFGKPHFLLAIVAGLAAAALWVLLHRAGLALRLPHPLFGGAAKSADEINLFRTVGEGWQTWAIIVTKIATASIVVPLVEELFWRVWLLRILVDWQAPERVPLATFTWRSFLISSLLSTLQHPAHWFTSIFCWFAFNGLFYWKKSIWFLVLVHGFTNLFLYIYVVRSGDWIYW